VSTEKTVDEQIAELLERRKAAQEAHDTAHKLQRLKDLEALVELETEHGMERLIKVDLRGWKIDSGAVTLAVAKRARKSDKLYKRFVDMVRRSKKGEKIDEAEVEKAGDLLAQSCLVYPVVPENGADGGAYEATLELFPGFLTTIAAAVVEAAMGKAQEEGKG